MSNTNQLRRGRAVRMVATGVVALSIALSGVGSLAQGLEPPASSAEAMARGLRPFQVYLHAPYKSPAEGVELLYKAIKEEMRDPTKLSENDAHWVENQSVLATLAFEMGGRAQEGKEGEIKLRNLLAAETNQQVKDLLLVALGYFRDKTVWRNLVGIMKQKGRSLIRECAARALCECNARLAIPDLIEALKDSEFVIRYVPTTVPHIGQKAPVFPVRDMASHVLGIWGVKVERLVKTKPFDFEVDKASAVNALKPELHNKDKEHVKEAIEAVTHVGGPAAKAELKRFILEQECVPAKAELVIEAKEALFRMEAAKKVVVCELKGADSYEPGKSSLVEVLVATLACKNQDEALFAALDAIAQCDGKLAKRELERFVAENSDKPERSVLVTKARELLSRIKP